MPDKIVKKGVEAVTLAATGATGGADLAVKHAVFAASPTG
jgi:hypothetical protein